MMMMMMMMMMIIIIIIIIIFSVTGTASGTLPSTVTSFSDYITRAEDHRSVLRFDKGESQKFCRVAVIDDSLFEEEEEFRVVLTEPMGGRVGAKAQATVFIQPDKTDGQSLSRFYVCWGVGCGGEGRVWVCVCVCVYADRAHGGPGGGQGPGHRLHPARQDRWSVSRSVLCVLWGWGGVCCVVGVCVG